MPAPGGIRGPRSAIGWRTVTKVALRARSDASADRDEATVRLLRERVRMSLWVTLVALAVLWATDATFNADVVLPLTAITLLQMSFAVVGFAALGRVYGRRTVATIPLLVLGGNFATGVVSDVISSNPQGVGLSALITCMVSAALMPWGVWFQTAMVVVSAVLGGLSVWLVTGSLTTLGYAAGPGAIVLVASISVAHAFERARQERLRVEDELRLLQTVSLEVGAAADPDAALTIVLRRICEASGWLIGQAWTVGTDQRALECTAWWSADEHGSGFHAASRAFTFAPGIGLPGRVWATKQPLWVGDLQHEPNFPRAADAARADLTAAVGIPVLADGDVIAVLEFFVRGPHGGAEQLIARFAGVAVQLGAVLQRKRAERALALAKRKADDEAQIAAALVEVGQVLSSHLGRDDMLAQMSNVAAAALRCDWSALFLCDDVQGAMHLAAAAGISLELTAALRSAPLSADAFFPVAIVRPGHLTEVTDVTRLAHPPLILRRLEAAAMLQLPICLGGTVIGLQLHGYRSRTGSFSQRQRRLATGVADATAIAIANARLIEDLQASSRLKSEFVATMSHELRTPLNIILGYSDMLAEGIAGGLAPAQRDLVARVQRAGAELLDLVSATLDLGRLESGRDAVQHDTVDLEALLHQLDAELRPLVAADVQLRWRREPGTPTVCTDKSKLKTILKNLVGNALKFTASGSVDVIVQGDAERLHLEVRDTGIGIPAASVPVIFDMFRQVDGSSTRTFGGVGLGLHIVRRLVDLLGGHVAVESEVGVGSTFTAAWPASRPAEPGRLRA